MSILKKFLTRFDQVVTIPINCSALPAEFFIEKMDEANNNLPPRSKLQVPVQLKKLKKYFRRSFFIPGVVAAIFIVLVGFATVKAIGNTTGIISGDDKVKIADAKATQEINKTLQFPLKDAKGNEVSKITYIIESAEIRDELIVKGKKARAVDGRTFLVIRIKVINTYKQSIQVTGRDYIRLIINDGKDKFAADIHNDPIEIQPDSTKQSRLAFPINEDDKNLSIQIGELKGKKEIFKLNFK